MLKASAIFMSVLVMVSSVSPALAQQPKAILAAEVANYRRELQELESLRARADFARKIRAGIVIVGVGASAYQFFKGAKLLKRAKTLGAEGNPDMKRAFTQSASTELTRGALYLAGTGSVVYINSHTIKVLDDAIATAQSTLRELESALDIIPSVNP